MSAPPWPKRGLLPWDEQLKDYIDYGDQSGGSGGGSGEQGPPGPPGPAGPAGPQGPPGLIPNDMGWADLQLVNGWRVFNVANPTETQYAKPQWSKQGGLLFLRGVIDGTQASNFPFNVVFPPDHRPPAGVWRHTIMHTSAGYGRFDFRDDGTIWPASPMGALSFLVLDSFFTL